jgi:ABC-type phosphate/phosphonate transport system substrate-binding protein
MHLASLAMYVTPQPLADATAELWSFLRHHLAQARLSDLPESLDVTVPYDEAWLREDLLFSQTCGYPYVKRLRRKVRLVATPVYAHPGCDGPLMRSFVVVRRDSGFASLQDLSGAIAAINSPDSNSGANLLRAAAGPLARSGRFFSGTVETGSHGGSIDAVSDGRADCAAIDCVTFANLLRFTPARIEGIRILAETPATPGLPFITGGKVSDADVALMREALVAAIAAPSLSRARDILGLVDVAILTDADYEPVLSLARRALETGYSDWID